MWPFEQHENAGVLRIVAIIVNENLFASQAISGLIGYQFIV